MTLQPAINDETPTAIAIIGPTAVGKTELSLRLAEAFHGEIISVDSMQVYRHMDVGTAKASAEELHRVPHHLINIKEPDEDYNVSMFIEDALHAARKIDQNNHLPFLVGGTGLYLKGLTEGVFEFEAKDSQIRRQLSERLTEEGREALFWELQQCDPVSAGRIHPNDTHRLLRALEIYHSTGTPWSVLLSSHQKKPFVKVLLKIGLMWKRDELYDRINERVGLMMRQGLLGEVEKLLNMGYGCGLKSMQSIGYRHMCNYIRGKWSLDKALETLARDTRRYAKRQLTWFSKDLEIKWFSPVETEEMFSLVQKILSR